MGTGKGIGKLFDVFKSAAIADSYSTLMTMGATAVGLGANMPVLLCGAVAIAGLTGWSAWRDWKTGDKLDKLDSIAVWLQEMARRKGRADAALEQVLEYAIDPGSDARKALPAGVEEAHLARLLAIIKAEGKDREKLLLEQKAMVELLGGFLSREFEQLKHRLDLQDAELAIIRRDARRAASGTQFLEWLLLDRESPPLHLPSTPLEESTRFIYSARRVRMRGRDAEMDELSAFLEADGPFRWAAWTGMAGMGKSRLALEFCDRAAESGWEVGFYDWRVKREPAWDKWAPGLPTLIVFDYVQEHAAKIGEAIGILASQAAGLCRKVRFLLLERPAPDTDRMARGSWWETLLDRAHETNAAAIASSCHDHKGGTPHGDPCPRPLGGLDAEAVKGILAELASMGGRAADGAELDRQLKQLERVSPDRRPLYVALAAEAIGAGDMRPNWDAQELTRYVLKKERARWGKALVAAGVLESEREPWINLYMLATMCGGLSIGGGGRCVFDEEALKGWVPTIERYGDGSTCACFAHGATGDTLPKLEPDMIGELFVLEEFGRVHRRDGAMRAAAWRHNAAGFGEFLFRAVNSFPRHPALVGLLRAPDAAPLADAFARGALAMALNNAVAYSESDFARADDLLGELRTLANQHPEDAVVREWLAKALFNAFYHSGSDFARANKLLGELRTLANQHPEDAVVREWLARALTNAVGHSESDFVRADELLGELRTLANQHPEEAVVREVLAMALFNAVTDSGSDFARANKLLGELRTLANQHPEEAVVREWLARALTNAVGHSESDFVRADDLLGELRTLANQHPKEAVVREQLAMALNNAVYHSGSDFARANKLLGELRTLTHKHPKDAAVREWLAKALFNAFNNSEANSRRAGEFLGDLRTLANQHPEDAAVRKQFAKALFNAFNNSEANSRRADDLFGELRGLAEANPEDATVREAQGRAQRTASLRGRTPPA